MQNQNQRPLLKLIQQRAEEIDSFIGMGDAQIFALRHLIQTTFQTTNIKLNINCYLKPKTITIQVFDDTGKEIYLRPKHPELLDKMLAFLGVKDYILKFKSKEDERNEDNS